MLKKYTILMMVTGSKQLYKYDVIEKDEETAIEKARRMTGDAFVSVQSVSTGNVEIIHR